MGKILSVSQLTVFSLPKDAVAPNSHRAQVQVQNTAPLWKWLTRHFWGASILCSQGRLRFSFDYWVNQGCCGLTPEGDRVSLSCPKCHQPLEFSQLHQCVWRPCQFRPLLGISGAQREDTAALLEDLTHKQGVTVTVSKGCGRGMPGGLCFLFHIIFIKIFKTEQMTKIPLVQSALFISILQPSRAEGRRGEKKTVLGPGSLR